MRKSAPFSHKYANCVAESVVIAVGSMFAVFAVLPKSTSQKHKWEDQTSRNVVCDPGSKSIPLVVVKQLASTGFKQVE